MIRAVGHLVIAQFGYIRVFGVFIGMVEITIIILCSVSIWRDTISILMEETPKNVDYKALKSEIQSIEDVDYV